MAQFAFSFSEERPGYNTIFSFKNTDPSTNPIVVFGSNLDSSLKGIIMPTLIAITPTRSARVFDNCIANYRYEGCSLPEMISAVSYYDKCGQLNNNVYYGTGSDINRGCMLKYLTARQEIDNQARFLESLTGKLTVNNNAFLLKKNHVAYVNTHFYAKFVQEIIRASKDGVFTGYIFDQGDMSPYDSGRQATPFETYVAQQDVKYYGLNFIDSYLMNRPKAKISQVLESGYTKKANLEDKIKRSLISKEVQFARVPNVYAYLSLKTNIASQVNYGQLLFNYVANCILKEIESTKDLQGSTIKKGFKANSFKPGSKINSSTENWHPEYSIINRYVLKTKTLLGNGTITDYLSLETITNHILQKDIQTYIDRRQVAEWDNEMKDLLDLYKGNRDKLSLPLSDYDYKEQQIYNPQTGEPYNPLGSVKNGMVEVEKPFAPLVPRFAEIGRESRWVDTMALIDAMRFLRQEYRGNSYTYATLDLSEALKQFFDRFKVKIASDYNDHPDYLRVFRLLRWYAEHIIYENSRFYLKSHYDKWVSQEQDGIIGYSEDGVTYDDWLVDSGIISAQKTSDNNPHIELDIIVYKDGYLRFSAKVIGSASCAIDVSIDGQHVLTARNYYQQPYPLAVGSHLVLFKMQGNPGDRAYLSNINIDNVKFKEAEMIVDCIEKTGLKGLEKLMFMLIKYYHDHHLDKKNSRKEWLKGG